MVSNQDLGGDKTGPFFSIQRVRESVVERILDDKAVLALSSILVKNYTDAIFFLEEIERLLD